MTTTIVSSKNKLVNPDGSVIIFHHQTNGDNVVDGIFKKLPTITEIDKWNSIDADKLADGTLKKIPTILEIDNWNNEMMDISTYDTNSNGVVDNAERLGGKLPSDYIGITDYTLAIPYAIATGSANNYSISIPINALVSGMAVSVKINVDSNGASTLNWDNKGPKNIKRPNGAASKDLKANGIYTFRYDGLSFISQGESDASTINGYFPGNASNNIPINNGILNINLNADKLNNCSVNDSGVSISDLLTANKIISLLNTREHVINRATGFNLDLEVSETNIKMNGVQSLGILSTLPRADHVHPSDITKANLESPIFTGVPKSVTPSTSDSSTAIATTAFVKDQSYLIGNQNIIVTGDATGSGTTNITLSLKNVGTNGIQNPKVTTDAQGRVVSSSILVAADIPTISLAKISDAGTAANKNVGTSSGAIPILDANGKLDTSVMPAIAITDTFVVASQIAMLGVTAETGDVAVRTDLSKSFILKSMPATTLANWQELLAPLGGVSTVAGKAGDVSLVPNDVGLGSVLNIDTTTTSNISDSINKRFCTDAQKVVLSNTTNTNTGDETGATIKTKLGVVTLSGSNTGDQDLSGLVPKTYKINGHALNGDISVTATDLGLNLVENKTSVTIRGEITSGNVTTALGYTPIKKYAINIGDGTSTTITVNHNLNSMDVTVLLREVVLPYDVVITDMQLIDANNIKLLFATAPMNGQYRIVITG